MVLCKWLILICMLQNQCRYCQQEFKNSVYHRNHERQCVQKRTCPHCSIVCLSTKELTQHVKVCPLGQHKCPICGKHCCSYSSLQSHKRRCRKRRTTDQDGAGGEKISCLRCQTCGYECKDRRQLYRHRMSQHGNANNLQNFNVDLGDDVALQREYDINRLHILAPHRQTEHGAVYNFPTNDLRDGVDEIRHHLEYIYEHESNAFRLNVAVGLILRDIETGQERYFIPLNNELLFDTAETVSSRRDLNRVLERLRRLDVREYVNLLKSKSSLKPHFVTNLVYYVSRTKYPLGAQVELPAQLKNHRFIVGVDTDGSGIAYDDNLCLFRCLYYHTHKRVQQAGVLKLYEKWCAHVDKRIAPELFRGVDFVELPTFEDCFRINVNMYEFVLSTESVIPRYLSREKHEDTLYVNVYENHTSYITDFKTYAKKYQCSMCHRHFDRRYTWKRHLNVCSNVKKVRFPGGFYSSPKTVFEELGDNGVHVPKEKCTFPYFAVYDFEAMLKPMPVDPSAQKLAFTHQHVPISVSINSNVPGFKLPHHIVNPDLDVLLQEMTAYLMQISTKACCLTREKLSPYIAELQQKLDELGDQTVAEVQQQLGPSEAEAVGFDNDSDGDDSDDCDENDLDATFIDDQEIVDNDDEVVLPNPYLDDNSASQATPSSPQPQPTPKTSAHFFMRQTLKKLQGKLNEYCSRLPVLGFNSAKYDLNLVKAKLAKHLKLHNSDSFTIKRAQAYTCISTCHFKFLDITSYLAAGASYAKFLKAYGVEEEKGFFPYEWFDCIEKLDYPHLPDYEHFFSQLKGVNVLEVDGCGAENYQGLQTLWTQKGMSTFRDLLKYYNNADVIGFVVAVEKLLEFYFDSGIDLFKDTISLPNLARSQLFKCTEALFPVFDYHSQDIYRTIQQNIVGGPSIIFKREARAGETRIRNNPNVIGQRIMGHDANGLYAYCIAQPMPTGCYVDRRCENDFRPEICHKYMDMYFWMDHVAERDSISIKHKLNNSNKEVRIGPYFVDGYCAETRTVYEFQGCWYHFCSDCQTLSDKPQTQKRQLAARKRTDVKRQYLLDNGYTVIEMKECWYKRNIEKNVAHIQQRYLPPLFSRFRGKMSETNIVDMLVKDQFFGMVECDISVPEQWVMPGDDRRNIQFEHDLSPKEYFSEMPPIFCTTDVHIEHFGQHMQTFVEDHDLSKEPRRLLVGGMSAKKILLITPLLQWYLSKGLRVSKIYRVIEFTPQTCFKSLTDRVSQARRDGDKDPSKAIIADTNKLLICSAYGGLLLNKEKHRAIKHIEGGKALRLAINDPKFCRFTELDDDWFEVELLKRNATLNLPNYLGFFVLNYAKLHMLQFVYDVLYKYIPRESFELMETDTDSIYAFYAGKRLEDLIYPHLRDEFSSKIVRSCHLHNINASTGHWFPRECCQEHRSYDKRTPGLFKLEASGDYMVCLSSKTYMLQDGDQTKFSCKGVQKRQIQEPTNIYANVLTTTLPCEVSNVGFRSRNNTMQTYTQRKTGFSYFYVKREVCANGIDTRPLSLTLCPWKERNCIIVGRQSVLSNDYDAPIEWNGARFFSAHHCFMHEMAVYHEQMDKATEVLFCRNWYQLKQIRIQFQPTKEWYAHATGFMQQLLQVKREQCVAFDVALRKERGKTVYVAGHDKYWSCGFYERIARVVDPAQYTGRNELGKLLYALINP